MVASAVAKIIRWTVMWGASFLGEVWLDDDGVEIVAGWSGRPSRHVQDGIAQLEEFLSLSSIEGRDDQGR